ncbi:MAG: DivIVA domain-containing protein [Actinomycetota bacterium]
MEAEQIESRRFAEVERGYDPGEVEAYLQEIADEMRRLSASAMPPADRYRQVGEQTSRILLAAEEASQQLVEAARREAADIVAAARADAEATARALEESRRSVEEDLRKLRDSRAVMATQLEDVQRRLEEMVSRLRSEIEWPAGPGPTSRPMPSVFAPDEVSASVPGQEPPGGAESHPGNGQLPKRGDPVSSAPGTAIATAPVEAHVEAEPAEEAPPAAQVPPEAKAAEGPAAERGEIPAPEGAESPTAQGAPEAPPVDAEPRSVADSEEAPAERSPPADAPSVGTLEPAPAAAAAANGHPPPTGKPAAADAIEARDVNLGDLPGAGARRLKRLLQEEQNLLLDRLRTHRGKATFDEMVPGEEQLSRLQGGLRETLEASFRRGILDAGEPAARVSDHAEAVIESLVARQVVGPLRRDLARVVETGSVAGDTPSAISERCNDVFRVWKAVRTQPLGEGLVHASYHHGLLDGWQSEGVGGKVWVVGPDEQACPKQVCASNAGVGSVPLDRVFPSGHLAPPAHGACTCTLLAQSP